MDNALNDIYEEIVKNMKVLKLEKYYYRWLYLVKKFLSQILSNKR